jgi:hypothetical protein
VNFNHIAYVHELSTRLREVNKQSRRVYLVCLSDSAKTEFSSSASDAGLQAARKAISAHLMAERILIIERLAQYGVTFDEEEG